MMTMMKKDNVCDNGDAGNAAVADDDDDDDDSDIITKGQ